MKRNDAVWSWARVLLLTAALCMGGSGCGRFSHKNEEKVPQPPDYVKVTGRGHANLARVASVGTLVFTGSLSGPIQASAVVPEDRQINDPTQRALMARAAARLKALRELGRVILETRGTQGTALGEALKKSPSDQSKLNTLLEQKAQLTYTRQDGQQRASAQIDGRQVMDALGLNAPASPATGPVASSEQEKKDMAYDQALEDAKKKLDQTLRAVKLPDGRTVEQALAEDAASAVDYNAMLWVVQPDETRNLPDGTCEVTIFFDRHRLPGFFKPRRHPWWTLGLPNLLHPGFMKK